MIESAVENSYSQFESPNPATRNVNLMSAELALSGQVSPETKAMILDEEITQAVEVLVQKTEAYGAVRRKYHRHGEELVDPYGKRLTTVLEDGIEWSEQEVNQGIPGAAWELERRKAELKNLQTVIWMPDNTACIEISPTPTDKPVDEQLAQHYPGNLTMIRASIKQADNEVIQYNYVVPNLPPEFFEIFRRKLGVEPETTRSFDSLKILENPVLKQVDKPADLVAKEIDSLIGASLLEASIGGSALHMIKKAIENRREAWQFAASAQHIDIHSELLARMERAACLHPSERLQTMNAIRTGFFKELNDRFIGNQYNARSGSILEAAASRAIAAREIYIACGSTIFAAEIQDFDQLFGESRASVVSSLLREIRGSGSCVSCGAKGFLYGCGFCGGCNKIWCNTYERSGKQLEVKQVAYLANKNPQAESFSRYWQRLGEEQRLSRERAKLREVQKAKLRLAP